MLRYMISPIIGNGSSNNEFRPAATDVSTTTHSSVIPTHTSGPDIGKPKYAFAFSLMGTVSVGAIAAVSNSFVFPDYPLDARMDGMEPATRAAMVQSVEAFTLDANSLHFDASHDDGESYREVLTRIVRQIEPAFSLDLMSVPEPLPA